MVLVLAKNYCAEDLPMSEIVDKKIAIYYCAILIKETLN